MERMQRHFDRWIRIILGILLIVLVLLCALLFHEYRSLRDENMVSAHLALSALHHPPTYPMTDVGFVQSWMTYDYIDHIYDLPPTYLQSDLAIVDTRYPRVSISESSEAQKVSAAMLTTDVKNAISNYIQQHNPQPGT